MLNQAFSTELLRNTIPSRAQYHPYPTIDQREAWDSLDPETRTRWLARGDTRLNFPWPILPATTYLRFMRDGNRKCFEELYWARRIALLDLVLAEIFENKGRFLDDIANGLWLICEESTWVVSAHANDIHGDYGPHGVPCKWVDLFAAESAAFLAYINYLLGDRIDRVSKHIRPRIEREIRERVLDRLHGNDDLGWMGLTHERPVNNWNPWICSNWLLCVLLIEEDSDRRLADVQKILRCLDRFIAGYPKDGGCDEGPMYWTRAAASLFDSLDLLFRASNGRLSVYQNEHIQNMAQFVYRAHINDSYLLNFADAMATGYPDPVLVYRFGQSINDRVMMDFGLWLRGHATHRHGWWDCSLTRTLRTMFARKEMDALGPGRQPLVRDVFLPGIEVFAARDRSGTADGFFVAAKGGHNDESHNHNDVGQFVVYLDGKPLLIDIGVETYTRKTFSDQRYTIWTMVSSYHNLPTIGGIQQQAGREFRAHGVQHVADDQHARFELELAAAYPKEAHVKSWRRAIELRRGQHITLTDHFELAADVPTIEWTLMTPSTVVSSSGTLTFQAAPILDGRLSASGVVRFDPASLRVVAETCPIEDVQLGQQWGTKLHRVRLIADKPARSGAMALTIVRH